MSLTAPHDSLFKFAFGDPVHATAFLRSLLPPEVAALVAWESFASERGSFVGSLIAPARAARACARWSSMSLLRD